MIKFVFAAMWIAAVSIGSVFYSFQTNQAEDSAEETPAFLGGLDYVNTDIISVPVLREDGVVGYFLARLVYTVEPDIMKKLSIPANVLIVDKVYDHLFANPQIDWSNRTTVDLDAFTDGVRDSINEEVGQTLVHDVMVEQIDFLSKSEIRDNTLRRRQAPTMADKSAAKQAGGEH